MVHIWVSPSHCSHALADLQSGLAAQHVTQTGISPVTRGREFCQNCAAGDTFSPDVQVNQNLNNAVSAYISNGAYASSPVQGKAWWFGGLTSANTSQPIEYSPPSDSRKVSVTNRIFIEASLALDGSGGISFAYRDVPGWVPARAESSLTWLPYGKSGMLVLMGGVVRPADVFTENTGDAANNTFMSDLVIYDIDGKQWYNQSTLEKGVRPQQLAGFCSAVVPTADGNGHEIFVYGGYDGTWNNSSPYDDVWALSIPAFQWTKVYDGTKTAAHGRQGNVCVAPNPSTLISIGGTGSFGAPLTAPHGVDIFDLNKLSWTGIYEASSSDPLQLPQAVVSQVGGTTSGPGSSAQLNSLSSGVSSLLLNRFQTSVPTYYPYAGPSKATGSPNATHTGSPQQGGGHKSHALTIALAVAIPVVVLLAAAIIACCCVKKRRQNRAGVERTQESRGNVFSWLGKSSSIDPAPEKSHTSDETAVDRTGYIHDKQPMSEVYEAPGSGPTTPGWGTYAHGSPQVLGGSMATSPFMGSAEVDAQSRHEIMDHAPREGQSLRQHPMYPRSFSGDQVMSVRSDSISHASTSVIPSRHYGYVSPYELPQDRSNENLATPPADVSLGASRTETNPTASTHSLGLEAEHVLSPVALIPVAPVSRKPVSSAGADDNRPHHQRNQSSMSSDLPNLPSPGPEEDRRRSRLIDTLPDPKSAQSSPIQPQTAKKSVYKENLDA